MKYTSESRRDYLDHLKIEKAKKDANFVAWEDVKARLDKKHKINSKSFQYLRKQYQTNEENIEAVKVFS